MRVHKFDYEKPQPSKDGGLIYLFCEGQKTEPNYFNYFKRKSSNLNLYIVPFPENRNNSHLGLFNYCVDIIEKADSDYDSNLDTVWLCFDTDDQTDTIQKIKTKIEESNFQINIAQSNRSFEVWLYYHFFDTRPNEIISNWKMYLNDNIPGGFNFRTHPEKANQAIENAKKNFEENDFGQPSINTTNVYQLIQVILEKVQDKI